MDPGTARTKTRVGTSWIQFDQTKLTKCGNHRFEQHLELSGARKGEKKNVEHSNWNKKLPLYLFSQRGQASFLPSFEARPLGRTKSPFPSTLSIHSPPRPDLMPDPFLGPEWSSGRELCELRYRKPGCCSETDSHHQRKNEKFCWRREFAKASDEAGLGMGLWEMVERRQNGALGSFGLLRARRNQSRTTIWLMMHHFAQRGSLMDIRGVFMDLTLYQRQRQWNIR